MRLHRRRPPAAVAAALLAAAPLGGRCGSRHARDDDARGDDAGPTVWLRVAVQEVARDSARCTFAWSADGVRFTAVGAPFLAREGKWVGAKVGLFAVGADTTARVDVDWLRVR